ncbi:MAG: hypothetical protein J6V95_07800, partial [Bacteroidaceae bacterium]|nr:hypothetical protein [Bacteroidaceae bacterium]
ELDGTKDVMNIFFSTPYLYKGGNLLIGCYEYERGNYKSANFYGENVTGACISGNGYNINNITPYHRNFLPKTTFWYENYNLILANDDSQADDTEKNTAKISEFNNKTVDVTLKDRVLYKDGEWNTLCLPFDVSTTTGPLSGDGVEVQILNTELSNLSGTVLTLNFDKESTGTISAGTPFIIKWTKPDGYDTDPDAFDIIDPEFKDVTITSETPTAQSFAGGRFVGQYSSFKVGDKTNGDDGNLNEIIVLGANSTIGYYDTPKTLRTFRAHFEIPEESGEKSIKRGIVNFADGTTTDVILIQSNDTKSGWQESDEWYTIDGILLPCKPTEKGMYINNGVTIKIF